MSNLTQSALAVASLKALSKLVAEREAEAKACLLEDMAQAGAASVNATLPNSARVATISFVAPNLHAAVADSVTFIAWLAENNPDAIEVVEVPAHTEHRVRPEFFDGLTCHGLHAFTEDGEEVPGVVASAVKPYLAVKSLKTDEILAAFAKGSLDAAALLALPAGEES